MPIEKPQSKIELTLDQLEQKGDLIIKFFRLEKESHELSANKDRQSGDDERLMQLVEEFNQTSAELGKLGFGKEDSANLRRFVELKEGLKNPNPEDQQNFQEIADELNALSAKLAHHGLNKDKVRELLDGQEKK